MSVSSYWTSMAQQRASRRAVVVGGAGLAGAAALLAACGGSSKPSTPATTLVAKPVDAGSSATKGGRMVRYISNDVTSFDGIAGNTGVSFTQSLHAHSRLVKYVPGKAPKAADGGVEPDAASSWEVSGDGMQVTFHIRPNMKYDPRPPTNGRAMNSADMKYTWDRFVALNQGNTDLTGRPESPIAGVTVPDDSTFVIKLNFPYAPLLTMLAYYRYMSIQPVEYANGFNFKSEMRGTGPWRLMSYTPGSKISYDRNPDWYDAGKMYLDGLDYYVLPEYATALSQFRAGNLWTTDGFLAPEDTIQTKNDLPNLILQSTGVFTRSISPYTAFSVLPGSPFLDERVRQAVSMLIDRDSWIDTFFNVSAFQKQGLDVPTRWNTHLPSGEEKYWVDPHGSELGAGAQYFKYDPAGAKKLLAAAGNTGPIEAKYNWTSNGYGPTYIKQVDVYQGMWEANGDFKLTRTDHDYASDWTPNYHQGHGKYDGIVTGTMTTQADIGGYLVAAFRSGGPKTWWGLVDPQMDSLIDQQTREPDSTKRISLIKQFDQYVAQKMYTIQSPGEGLAFTLAQPFYGNRGVYRYYEAGNQGTEQFALEWYDATKKSA